MSPAQVLERSYALIKRQLLDGHYPPGHRLEAARLADDIHVSITPVRDVLNRLTGEGLVRALAGDGFYVPVLTEQDLRDLLHWNVQLLAYALRHISGDGEGGKRQAGDEADLTTRVAMLFLNFVAQIGNSELIRAIASANDRLHAIRLREAAVLENVAAEIITMEDLWRRREFASLRDRLRAYHRRRQNEAARLLKQLGSSLQH